MSNQRWPRLSYILLTALLLLTAIGPSGAAIGPGLASAVRPRQQPETISFYGINGYFTGYERPGSEVLALLPTGPAIGLDWSREEFSWASIELEQDYFDWSVFDLRVRLMAEEGYGVIGMLLTTPTWARQGWCSYTYWCPPQNVNDFAQFAGAAAERYDGDGYNDAFGSPRVAYWEIWNEPNHPTTWPGSAAQYAALLRAGYEAIKAADPTAQVLVGGVYVFDGVSGTPPAYDGLVFLESVMLADPAAWNAFDILSIHPYMPDAAPDEPGLQEEVTMLGRIQNSIDWVNSRGGGKEIWITEVGWSTCQAGVGDCNNDLSMTEDQQANYLLRTHAIALAMGVEHLNTFQLEDKFDGGQSAVWGGCAVLRTGAEGYAPKVAYHALGRMVTELGETTYHGEGPLHLSLWYRSGGRNRLSAQTRFDYRFIAPNGGYVDVLWRPDETTETVYFPTLDGWTYTWVDRDGVETPLTPVGGSVSFPIDGRPGYLRQEPPPQLSLPTTALGYLAQEGEAPPPHLLRIENAGGGSLNWTISFASGSEWFDASPLAGTAPATVTVSPTPPVSGTGTFNGVLVVDAGTAGQGQVDLTLRVVAQLQRLYLPLVPKSH